MRALVTGATGFIGANLVRELVRDEFHVRALVRPGSDTLAIRDVAVETVTGDLLDKASLARAVEGCDVVFHVAALYRLWSRDRKAHDRVNVQGTRNVLEAAVKAKVERVVYTSTASVFGHWRGGAYPSETSTVGIDDLVDGYHLTKYLAEIEAQKYLSKGLDLVIVNPTTPMGPFDVKPTPTGRIVLDFMEGRMPAYIDTGLNVVHVKDVVRGHMQALEKGKTGERYILGNRNVSLKELFRILAAIVGRSAPAFRMPYWLALGAAHLENWLSTGLLNREPTIPLAGVRMARRPMYFDPSKAVQELGMPQTPIEGALEEAVGWFRRRPQLRAAA